jgi:uncharacterized alkaline shock family protein YloU
VSLVVTTELGTVTVPDAVVAGIAVRAAETVEGLRVRRRRGVDLEATVLRLTVEARRGEPLHELAGRAQDAVADALQAMCGLETKVDVTIAELA